MIQQMASTNLLKIARDVHRPNGKRVSTKKSHNQQIPSVIH